MLTADLFSSRINKLDQRMHHLGGTAVPPDNAQLARYQKELEQLVRPMLEAERDYVLLADDLDLHRRLTGSIEDFETRLERYRQRPTGHRTPLGVSRYNFFRLDQILHFASTGERSQSYPEDYLFRPRPFRELRRTFLAYLTAIAERATAAGLELVWYDPEVPELINSFAAAAEHTSERELIRLFGVVVEHAFIGPQTIVLDPHHLCNASCEHCWIHTPDVHHEPDFYRRSFDWEVYKALIDDCAAMEVDGIIFQGDGEPLAYRRFRDMLIYARDREVNVSFFTNGILLDEELAALVVDRSVKEIFCSLPAATSRTWGKINTRCDAGTFDTILSNLSNLTRLKRAAGVERPVLQLTHVIHTMNWREVPLMARNDAMVGADLSRFYLIRLDHNLRYLQLRDHEVAALMEQIPRVRAFLRSTLSTTLVDNIDFQLNNYAAADGSWASDTFLRIGCTIGFYFCLIPARLDLSLCCHLRTIGHLDWIGFKELWFSDHYQRIRHQAKHLRRYRDVNFLNGARLYDEHCTHCDNHQQLLRTNEQLQHLDLLRFC
ncbi:MAG: hypothetical protein A2284_16715 [Deltaproteobacteria bacterium RIFOXYA12_FULL_61_11]|nr:MAG: hypothetical protein A2284_16715 [Deltaproteobacteria bacterium RIFOXYA12_FULL_61_11]